MKKTLSYEVRTQRDPTTGRTIHVPAIVERSPAVTLKEVVENAIDRGLIPGIKPSAAQGIADGVAAQMYDEYKKGNGVKYGDYFYGRLYLDGTCSPSGILTDKNHINVRLYKGPGFALTRQMFTFHNINDGDTPSIEFVLSGTDGAMRGQFVPGAPMLVNGLRLWGAGDLATAVVLAWQVDGAVREKVVDAFTSKGENLLSFAWPADAGLAAGMKVEVTVRRTPADGMERESGAVTATIVGEGPSGPTFTKVTAPGHEDDPDWVNKVSRDGQIVILGTGFTDAVTAEFSTDGTPETFNVTARTSTSITGQIAGGLEAGGTLVMEMKDGAGDVIDTASVEVVE